MTEPVLTRHPLNVDFEWPDHTGPFRRVTDEQAKQFDELGYFLLEDAIDPATVATVTAAIDPFDEKTAERLRSGGGALISNADTITFSIKLVQKSEELRAFSKAPVFQDLGHDLIGADVSMFWDQAVYKKPEADREFPWHQDNGYTFVEPQAYLTCWVALTDATVDNGCPWVVPGVHRMGTLEHEWTDTGYQCFTGHPDAIAVPARAGSIVVFSSLTPHRTGPNLTDGVRKAYILQYSPPDAVAHVADDAGKFDRQALAADCYPILVNGQPA